MNIFTKNIIKVIFIIINIIIYLTVVDINNQKDCPCSSGFTIENIKMISLIIIFILIINTIIPLISILYTIPVISTVLTFTIVALQLSQLFLLVRLGRSLNMGDCYKKCKSNWLLEKSKDCSMTFITITALLFSTIILTI